MLNETEYECSPIEPSDSSEDFVRENLMLLMNCFDQVGVLSTDDEHFAQNLEYIRKRARSISTMMSGGLDRLAENFEVLRGKVEDLQQENAKSRAMRQHFEEMSKRLEGQVNQLQTYLEHTESENHKLVTQVTTVSEELNSNTVHRQQIEKQLENIIEYISEENKELREQVKSQTSLDNTEPLSDDFSHQNVVTDEQVQLKREYDSLFEEFQSYKVDAEKRHTQLETSLAGLKRNIKLFTMPNTAEGKLRKSNAGEYLTPGLAKTTKKAMAKVKAFSPFLSATQPANSPYTVHHIEELAEEKTDTRPMDDAALSSSVDLNELCQRNQNSEKELLKDTTMPLEDNELSKFETLQGYYEHSPPLKLTAKHFVRFLSPNMLDSRHESDSSLNNSVELSKPKVNMHETLPQSGPHSSKLTAQHRYSTKHALTIDNTTKPARIPPKSVKNRRVGVLRALLAFFFLFFFNITFRLLCCFFGLVKSSLPGLPCRRKQGPHPETTKH